MFQYDEMVALNRQAIENLIQVNSLKKWWVAEFAGVHKTTLRRWLSGEIQKARRENVRKLAEVLSSSESVISYSTPSVLQ